MAYSVDFSDTAKAQLLAAPLDVALAVADVVAAVSVDPWNYARDSDEPLDRSRAHRRIPFAGGVVWCLILERDAEVYVTELQWA